MGYMQSCLGAQQQTITHGREGEPSSHLRTHDAALLRFGKATGNSETSVVDSGVGEGAHAQQMLLCQVQRERI